MHFVASDDIDHVPVSRKQQLEPLIRRGLFLVEESAKKTQGEEKKKRLDYSSSVSVHD